MLLLWDLYAEIPGGVAVGDALHDLFQGGLMVGVLPVLRPAAHQVAQDAAEVVVAGVAEDTAIVSLFFLMAPEFSVG